MKIEHLIYNLNHSDRSIRLQNLFELAQLVRSGELEKPLRGNDVNNHIHTTYSFSPYSPAKAVWMAYNAGLSTAGIMDHDSSGGADEFIEAGKIIGLATTIGVECRADFSNTLLNGKTINNPDQCSIGYVALHGIPHSQITRVQEFFKPYTYHRNIRNAAMVEKLNLLISSSGVTLNYENDVVPVSFFHDGGSITERHILYAFALKLITLYGKGNNLINFLKEKLLINVNSKVETYLADENNPYYEYDLLGLLKSELVSSFYIDATAECPDIKDIIGFSKSIGSILAYAYLGDVGSSVTGDKKTQKFEDDYIELLFSVLKELQFDAITYMPSRNSYEQLETVRNLCDRYSFFQLSGEDINSPRQSFICKAQRNDIFDNLQEATWALVGHELSASQDLARSMFSDQSIIQRPDLSLRIQEYAAIGRKEAGLYQL